MRESWKSCLLTSRRYVPKILPRPREKNNISGQLKLMRGDTLNRGQGLLPYGGPGCKSESRGERVEDERSGRLGSGKGDAAPTPPNPQICLKTAAPPPTSLSPSTLFSLPPPLPPCPCSTPRCNAPRYLCRTGSFIKPCFFSSRWEDLNELSS